MKRTPGSERLVFCGSGNYGTKAHVSRDVRGFGFGPMCRARSSNRLAVFAYSSREVEEEHICSKCLKFTKAIEQMPQAGQVELDPLALEAAGRGEA